MKTVFTFLLFVLMAGSAFAASSEPLHGAVSDDQQRISGAGIVIKSADTVVAQTKTGPDGSFDLSLEPGSYTIEVTAEGYDKAVQAVNLTPDLAPLSFAMKVAKTDLTSANADDDSSDSLEMDQDLRDYLMQGTGPRKSDSLVLNLLLADTTATERNPSFRGTVMDERQAGISGAGVVVKSGDQVIAELKTGAQGMFDIPLKPGQYTVEITVAGFDKTVQTIDVTADSTALSFPMKVTQTPGPGR